MNDLSDVAKVRRWARANGHEVADRGRIARHIVAASDLVNGADVMDRSGRRPAPPATIEAIERMKARQPMRSYVSTVVIVDEDGTEHPLHPELLRPAGSAIDPLSAARPSFDWRARSRRR